MQVKKGRSLRSPVLLIILILALLIPIGCQRSPAPGQPSGEVPGADAPASTMPLAIYYVKFTDKDAYLVREVHEVARVPEVARAALDELIKGTPLTQGANRVLPANTKVKGISIDDQGMATVDFSPEVLQANVGSEGEALGIASIVNTLTEFPTIKKVSFTVDGQAEGRAKDWWGHVGLYNQPFERDLSKVYEPNIWVSLPTVNQVIKSPVEITGSARVFEAAVCARVVDEQGKELAQGCTTASAGAPERGDFKLTLNFNPAGPGKGVVEAYSTSPKDGSVINLYKVPVSW